MLNEYQHSKTNTSFMYLCTPIKNMLDEATMSQRKEITTRNF